MGIGEDGIEGLTAVARGLVSGAEIVFGGKRHLGLAAALIRGAVRPWPSPFEQAVAEVLAQRGRQVCVLASGDPYLYGVGAVLARHVDPGETVVVPAPSAFSLAAARLGWPLADCALLSLHGRALDRVRPHLQPGARVLALTSDGEGPASLAALLATTGFGASRFTVLEALGGPRERISASTAAAFDPSQVDPLNTVAIEVVAADGARIIARAPGLPDQMFEHDGQITKREVRAVTLSSLAPRRGELLWDVGAGAGSVAIEWMLADPSLRAIAIEAQQERAARIGRNAASFGVPGVGDRARRRAGGTGRIAGAGCDFRRRRGQRSGRARCGGGGAAPRRPPGGQCRHPADRSAAAGTLCGTGWRADPHRHRARRSGRHHDGLATGHAGHPVAVGEAMMVAGVGCRRGTSADAIESAITAALAQAGLATRQIDLLATAAFKGDEPGIAAARRGPRVRLVLVAQADLERVGNRATHSRRVDGLMGVGSVAEAAALAAGGPAARLVVPRIVIGPVTCALVETAAAEAAP